MMKKFFKCGVIGWCLEIVFTSIAAYQHKDYRLKGNTSLWMFPIYGLASFLCPISHILKGKPLVLRGSIYTVVIFLTEFVTGKLLKKRNLCPWDYQGAPLNIDGVIRLDYAPFWFGTGLLYELLLNPSLEKAS